MLIARLVLKKSGHLSEKNYFEKNVFQVFSFHMIYIVYIDIYTSVTSEIIQISKNPFSTLFLKYPKRHLWKKIFLKIIP